MPPTNLFWRTFRPTEGFYTSEVQVPAPLPVGKKVRTGNEPSYPYPLLVFFHGHGGNEEQILKLAPRLSRRNYISIGLRGTQPLAPGDDGSSRYGWGSGSDFDSQVEDYLIHAVEQARRSYHIHSERIYLAGVCEGATLAYRLALQMPDRFAGVISLNGAMPRRGCPLLRFPDVRQLRVFIGHGIANAYLPLTAAKQDFSLLYTAGLDVQMQTYPANHRLHPDMLRDINRWIMTKVNEE